MPVKSRPVKINELDDPDTMFLLKLPDASAYVTIVRALSYTQSRVCVHQVLSGNSSIRKDEILDVENGQLEAVIEVSS